MSLEQALQENTDAVKALTLILTAQGVGATSAAPAKAATPKAETAPKKETAAASTPKPTPAQKAEPAKPAAKEDDAIDPSYAPVKAAILAAIAGGHRTAISAMLKEYGAKTGQDLDASNYDEVLGKIADITGDAGDLA